jgi:ankyrin repeat protein
MDALLAQIQSGTVERGARIDLTPQRGTRSRKRFELPAGCVPAKRCALHAAARQGNLESIRSEATPEFIHARDSKGRTPLMVAVRSEQDQAAALLLELGSDPNAQDKDGLSPLHRAVKKHNAALVGVLVTGVADVERVSQVRDSKGETALDMAVAELDQKETRAEKELAVIAALLLFGARANVKKGKRSPLHRAVAPGRAGPSYRC